MYNDFLQCLAEARVVSFVVAYALQYMITDPSAREVLREIVDTVVGPTVSFEQITGS